MLANFLNDTSLREQFEVSLSFRDSAPYRKGLKTRVADLPKLFTPAVVSDAWAEHFLTSLPSALSFAMRTLLFVSFSRYWILLWNIWVLRRAWRHSSIDILHINNGGYPGASSCRAATIAAKLCGIKNIIMVVNNMAAPPRASLSWLENHIDRAVNRADTIFVTASQRAGQALAENRHFATNRIKNLHNGINMRLPNEARAKTRVRLGLNDTACALGVVAILEHRKGHAVLINAMARLDQSNSSVMPCVFIEGTGPLDNALRALVDQHNLNEHIKFVGRETHVFDFMQAMDIIALPSIANEDFPNVILEAMCLGKPVIASNIAGTPEQIQDGETGYIVPPGDVDNLALTIQKACSDKTKLKKMGENAKKRFNMMFNADIAVKRYLNLYQSLLLEHRSQH